jgi:hypothetical protein
MGLFGVSDVGGTIEIGQKTRQILESREGRNLPQVVGW